MIYHVYYQRFFGLLTPVETRRKYLNFTHRLLRQVEAAALDEVYSLMQGEVWSPQGEARPLIQALHLSHTSLSMGDVVRDAHGRAWVCDVVGWLPLRGEPFRPLPGPAPHPPLWLATEADVRGDRPRLTRLKITNEPDCLPADAYTVERFGWVAFADLVALARLIEQRFGWQVCIDLGAEFYETSDGERRDPDE
jgi:hypothetical protein